MAPLATLVLDLDGTIVDSLPDLTAALNRLMTARGVAGFPATSVSAMVGDGTTKLVERAFAARSGEARPDDIEAFVADYTAHATEATRAFPGVEETLGRLKASGWQFAICTNKTTAATHAVLDALGLAHWFAALGCGDTFPVRKPNPAHLLGTLDAASGDPRRAVMVGDHANDIAVAKGAGLPSIFAAWGYGARSMAAGASAVAERFTALATLGPKLLS